MNANITADENIKNFEELIATREEEFKTSSSDIICFQKIVEVIKGMKNQPLIQLSSDGNIQFRYGFLSKVYFLFVFFNSKNVTAISIHNDENKKEWVYDVRDIDFSSDAIEAYLETFNFCPLLSE